MKCLVVIAHPLTDSLCHSLAKTAIDTLKREGHEVVIEDLYAEGFAPALTEAERRSYYSESFDANAVAPVIERLLAAEALVLVFPTWWFGFPAVLKGWFDRVWAPGVAYDHASDLGPIKPRLDHLQRALAVTTLGAAGWVDRLVMWQPVRRVLSTAILGTCAPRCSFEMLTLYKAEKLAASEVETFCGRIRQRLKKWS